MIAASELQSFRASKRRRTRPTKTMRLQAMSIHTGRGVREEGMQDFRKSAVWRKSHELTLELYAATKEFPEAERYELARQVKRAAISVESDIAEGSSRQSDSEFQL